MNLRTLFTLFFLFTLGILHAQQDRYPLTQWRFTCPDPADTSFTTSGGATVPGCIHTDLLHQGLIPNPFYGTNEDSLQWLSDAEVTYSCEIWREDLKQKKNLDLVFEGVTGYAEVYLNGQPINHLYGSNVMDNAFRTWRFPLDGKLYAYNLLEVKFTPARRIIDQRKSKLSYTLPDDRALLRTPPYQAGWDWGPKLTTCGITGNVYILKKGDIQFKELEAHSIHAENGTFMHVKTVVSAPKRQKFHYECYFDGKKVESADGEASFQTEIISRFKTENLTLWYPNGMGEQNLHDIAIVIKYGKHSDTIRQRIGVRTIELREEKDSIGQSFEFIVNGQPTFMKGVNWIPADFFPTQMTEARYRELLQACKDANMNMIRVWGGGIYEPDIFYDLCDEMGLLVWQDFMYACALYPGDYDFLYNARMEANEQVKRLKRHPCIATWCGNNEVKNGWDDWGWKQNYTPEQQDSIAHNIEQLFNCDLMSSVIFENGHNFTGTPYVSTSPLWGWGHPECCTEGDSHYWGVWWGEEPFEMYIPKTGRFMSEFGFQSYPDIQTLKTVIPEEQLHLGSPAMNSHQKHARGVQIIGKAMEQYFYVPDNLEDYIYTSQLVQAYGTGLALQEHRRRMPYCMGSLFWQLNDCWPVASWSCIDYYGRRKALYYEAKRDFEPVIIACDTVRNNTLPIYVVNDGTDEINGTLLIQNRDFSGNILSTETANLNGLKSQTSSLVYNYTIPSSIDKKNNYLSISIIDNIKKSNIAEKSYFFVYPGELNLQNKEENLSIKIISPKDYPEIYEGHANDIALWVSAKESLQYGVELKASAEGTFSDNFMVLEVGTWKLVYFTPKNSDVKKEDVKIWGHSFNELNR